MANASQTTSVKTEALLGGRKPRSYWADGLHRLFHDRGSVISLVVIALFLLVGAFAPLIAPHDPVYNELAHNFLPPAWVETSSTGEHGQPEFLLGTDGNGRDVLTRLLYGTRTSLLIGLVAGLAIMLAGTLVGAVTGFVGGWFDNAVMRIIDVLLAFPSLLFYIMVVLVLRGTPIGYYWSGAGVLILALALFGWLGMARLVRSVVLVVREQLFIEAAQAVGVSPLRVLFRHVLPNCFNTILVYMTFTLPKLIIAEATLGYLGIGVRPFGGEDLFFITSWGGMFNDGRRAVNAQPAMLIAVLLCVALVSMAFTRLGDGLRDAFDPGTRL